MDFVVCLTTHEPAIYHALIMCHGGNVGSDILLVDLSYTPEAALERQLQNEDTIMFVRRPEPFPIVTTSSTPVEAVLLAAVHVATVFRKSVPGRTSLCRRSPHILLPIFTKRKGRFPCGFT